MAKKVFHKRSSVLGQMPTGDTLAHGEIAVNFNSAAPFLSIKDSEGKYAKFSSDEAYLQGDKVLSDKYDELYAIVDENEQVAAHALTDLDNRVKELKESSDDYITADEVVLANAKSYADSKAKEIEDAYVLADNAILVDAKGYTDEKIAALPETYTKDEVDNLIGGVQENLTNEVKAREDAVTNLTDEIIKNELVISNSLNDLNARVDGVKETVDNLDFTSVVEEAKDYTDTQIKQVENAYKAADNTVLDTAKTYTDNQITALGELYTKNEVNDLLTNVQNNVNDSVLNHAKDTNLHVTTELQTKWNTAATEAAKVSGLVTTVGEHTTKIGTIETNVSKNAQDILNEVKAREDAVTNLTDEIIKNELAISNSLNDLNTRVNNLEIFNGDIDFSSIIEEANEYTDSKAKEIENAYKAADNVILTSGKTYTDEKIAALPETYTKTEVDNLLSSTKNELNASIKEQEDALTDLTNEIIDNEEVVAAALTDLDVRLVEVEEHLESNVIVEAAVAEASSYTDTKVKSVADAYPVAVAAAQTTAIETSTGYTQTYSAPKSHTHGTIALTGNAEGSADFTNTGAEIAVTVKNDSHTHTTSTISGTIDTKSGITSGATGLVQGKAVYEYAQPKGNYQAAGNYAVADHTHGLKLDGDVTGNITLNNGTVTMTTTVADNSHNHTASNITAGVFDIARIPTGTTTTTVALGKHTHVKSDISDFAHTHKVSDISDFSTEVDNKINAKLAANDAMLFKGTITSASLPTTFQAGWTYKVATAGTYYGIKFEVGDMIIAIIDGNSVTTSSSNFSTYWTAVQTNVDGHVSGPSSAINNNIAVFDGTTGKLIKDGGLAISDLAKVSHTHGTIALTGDVTGSTEFSNNGATITATVVNNSHYHIGSDITGGTIPIVVLPTGTTSTTVSRGDHTHSYITWVDGMNSATSLTNIPITKRMCKVTVSASATLTVTSGLAAGRELHILIYNSGSSAITVTMPTSGYVNFGEEAITIPSKLYAEVNILSDGSTYFIRNGQ